MLQPDFIVAAQSPRFEEPAEGLDQGLGDVSVLHGARSDHNGQHQPYGLPRRMAFAPFDFFVRILAALSGLVGRLGRLAVHNGGRGSHVAAFGVAQPVAQGVVDECAGPILAPLTKVAIDALTGAKVFGGIRHAQPARTT
jgi:hypothetical protein